MRDGVFGVAAARQQGADPVAHRPAVDIGADGGDLSRRLQPRQVGGARRRRIGPGALKAVWAVHPRGGDADQDLIRAGRRNRPFPRHKNLGAAWRGDLNGAHRRGQGHVAEPFASVWRQV